MSSKTKPKAIKPKDDAKKQSERFIQTARESQADESGKIFEAAFVKIVSAKIPPTGN